MERRKWFILPFAMSMVSAMITQMLVPNYSNLYELNPFANAIYLITGHFFFMPALSFVVFLFIMPLLLDWVISKTNDGEHYRMEFEALFIGMAVIWTSFDLLNNVAVFLSLSI